MSDNRYARLPAQDDELDAAFESDDEELDAHETTRLTRSEPEPPRPQTYAQHPAQQPYDFERLDYDVPPPGSPPPAPGNSNGEVPSFDSLPIFPNRDRWFTKFIPQRFRARPRGPIGGGSADGVFSNVTAKPSAQVTVTEGDSTYVVPEDSRAEAPPSYASAQADSVPPYWETTVHAPFSPDASGEMIVDSLPTGSLFSFLWNLLISVSFQFVGFLLTYLLHTTHAARLGSRTGLGITLIQWGFALRGKLDNEDDLWANPNWPVESADAHPFPTAIEGNGDLMNQTAPSPTAPSYLDDDTTNRLIADATTEWLSFFLMTIGWFIFLTSVLGFWRIKRWESSIIQSHRDTSGTNATQNSAILGRLELAFGLHAAGRADFLRSLYTPTTAGSIDHSARRTSDDSPALRDGDSDEDDEREHRETDFMLAMEAPGRTPEERAQMRSAIEHEARLHNDLRNAGLL